MSTGYIWLTIVLLMVTVLAMRWSFQLLPRRFVPRGALAQALGYAPLAALSAVCAPEMFKFVMQRGWNADLQLAALSSDWRFLAGAAMILLVQLNRRSKSATLVGLVAAALAIWVTTLT
jgi:branched-subunit amino acid transport protein